MKGTVEPASISSTAARTWLSRTSSSSAMRRLTLAWFALSELGLDSALAVSGAVVTSADTTVVC